MKTEHAIGETFTYNGVRVVVKVSEGARCRGCYLYEVENFINCDNVLCEPHNRKDKSHVIFTKIESNETEGLNCLSMLIDILKQSITIPAYTFQKIEILPLTEQLSVSILVDSENSFILHSSKSTPQEVGGDLNDQYERHLNTKTEQNTLK